MKVKILKTTVADGRFVRAGAVEDLSDKDAKALCLLGKAVAVEAEEAPVSAPEPTAEELTTETANAVIETKLKTKRRAK